MNESELSTQRELLRLSDSDLEHLGSLRSWAEAVAPELMDGFLQALTDCAESSRFLQDPALYPKLQRAMREHVSGQFSGRCDAAYLKRRLLIGQVHARIGLPPRLYLAALQRYADVLLERLAADREPAVAFETSRSLQKLISLDAALVLGSYNDKTQRRLVEGEQNARAVADVLTAVGEASTTAEAVRLALDTVRESFGWAYGSYWVLDREADTLRFALESGEVGEEFRAVTRRATFPRGVGVSGRTLERGDLLIVEDLGQVSDCVRAPAAISANVRSGVCLPIQVGERVVGTMDFFQRERIELSVLRQEALRNVGRLLGARLAQLEDLELREEDNANTSAVNHVLRAISGATSTEEAARKALDTVRAAFGWAYGSYWVKDEAGKTLRFAVESGEISPAFHETTHETTFPRGVGVSGRTWERGELTFVEDLGKVADCVRAPVAVQAGVKSGVCFPIRIGDEVVGTMDFFALASLTLSEGRRQALKNVAHLVSAALERLHERERFRETLAAYLERLTSVTSGLSDSMNTQSEVAQGLASSVAQVTATLSELRQTSAQTLQRAQQVIEEANASVSTSEQGLQGVEKAAESMRSISRQVEEISERILNLNGQTSQIGDIVASVNEIAAQSKLLALNAAIEAARAGRRGDGFAVVAGEIRSLSEQSREATRQIKEILNEIQEGTNQAVVSAEQGTKRVLAGVTVAEQSGANIRGLAHALETSSDSARLIANSARQQNAGVEEVASAMTSIRESAEAAAGGLAKTRQIADSLAVLADEIAGVIRADD